MTWIRTPNAPASDGQKYLIKILTEKIPRIRLVKGGEEKTIGDLTMKEADQVIKGLQRKIKKQSNEGKNNN